jgi:hypothetical protein
MKNRLFCKWITITGVLVILTVKWVIRPYYYFKPGSGFLLGIAPNFLGAFLLLFGAKWLLPKFIDWQTNLSLRMFCLTCFALLVINEYLQLIPVFGRTFDYFDIIASAAGLYISYLLTGKKSYANFLGKRVDLAAGKTNI